MQSYSPSEPPSDDDISPTPRRWLNQNVFGIGLTSLLSDAGHEMATAVLSGFLTVISAPVYALGVIEGAADAISSFVKLASGWWSDRVGHRKAISVGGYVLTGGAFVLLAAAASWPLVFLGRVIAWFGRGLRGPPRDAILAESVSPDARGKAFGFHRAGDTLGAIIGPLMAAGLVLLLQPYATDNPALPFRIIFLCTLVPGLAAAVVFAVMVKEERVGRQGTRFWASLRALPPKYRLFLVGVGVFGLGDFSHALLIMAATQLLAGEHEKLVTAQIAALLYALRNVLYATASYPVGALSDRLGRFGLLFFGYLLGAAVMLGFVGTFLFSLNGVIWLGALFALAGVYIAVEDALEGALTADLVPDEAYRGTAYGVLGTVNGLGDFLSSAIVGFLWLFAPEAGFAYAALAMLLGALLILPCFWKAPDKPAAR